MAEKIVAEKSADGRWIVGCARCGQIDDHPMHHLGVQAGTGQTPVSFHTDCHALMGCPVCLEVRRVADVTGEKGAELQVMLAAQPPLTDERITELLSTGGVG